MLGDEGANRGKVRCYVRLGKLVFRKKILLK